jgi:hypothetical protein
VPRAKISISRKKKSQNNSFWLQSENSKCNLSTLNLSLGHAPIRTWEHGMKMAMGRALSLAPSSLSFTLASGTSSYLWTPP